ncbi:unnamed protein product [Schistocephalus solidus]|uniref:Uncharacterized protein n=1 Tax=Schistocephalus solidus TaxID=70667 RepID=A0A3P7CRX6_SCHSO|nr:unnamed protein product [Schistocephalus solidus]
MLFIFCLLNALSRRTFVLTRFRTALSSLTRIGVRNYFLLLGHLAHSICVGPSPQASSVLDEFVQFVGSLFSLRGELSTMSDDAETKWWLDWEIGRRCAAMQGLQLLLLLILKTAGDLPSLDKAIRKLVHLSTRFRRALITCMQMSLDGSQTKMQGLTQSVSTSKLTGLGWRSELISRSVDFCECLLWPSPDSGLVTDTDTALAYLDSSVLEVVLSAENRASTSFFLRFLEEPSVEQSNALQLSHEPIVVSIMLGHSNYVGAAVMRLFVFPFAYITGRSFVWTKLYPKLIDVSSSLPAAALSDPDDGADARLAVDYAEMAVLLTSSLTLRFRGHYLRLLFGDSDNFSRFYALLVPQSDDNSLSSDSAWNIFIGWLLYRFLYCDSQDTEDQPRIAALLASRFPPELTDFVSIVDPDLALLRLSHRLDTFKSFHERMAYREKIHRHLLSLVCVLCAPVDLSLSTESPTEDIRPELLYVFRAAGTLVQTCASLLYPSPVPCQTSAFERLASCLLLAPQRIFEQSSFVPGQGRVAAQPPPYLVETFRECIGEHLSQFLAGFAQLGYEKDSCLVRLLRDLLIFVYRKIGVSWLASAVIMSPTAAFRAHALRLLSEDVADLFKSRSDTVGAAGQQSTGQVSGELARKLCTSLLVPFAKPTVTQDICLYCGSQL